MWFGKFFCGLDWVVEGREHIPHEGAHVSMWKHTSTWETMAQMVVMPPQAWVLKREILWIPLVGWACWMLKCIAIDRGSGHRAVNQVLDLGRERLAAGIWVLIFPEGTRMAPGQTRKYGMSGALLASQAGVKLVPVAHNAGDFWPRRGLVKKPGRSVSYRPADRSRRTGSARAQCRSPTLDRGNDAQAGTTGACARRALMVVRSGLASPRISRTSGWF